MTLYVQYLSLEVLFKADKMHCKQGECAIRVWENLGRSELYHLGKTAARGKFVDNVFQMTIHRSF